MRSVVYADEVLLKPRKEFGLVINVDKTQYMFMLRHQTVGQNYYTDLANKSLKNAAK
jgi:hypothetical protein